MAHSFRDKSLSFQGGHSRIHDYSLFMWCQEADRGLTKSEARLFPSNPPPVVSCCQPLPWFQMVYALPNSISMWSSVQRCEPMGTFHTQATTPLLFQDSVKRKEKSAFQQLLDITYLLYFSNMINKLFSSLTMETCTSKNQS